MRIVRTHPETDGRYDRIMGRGQSDGLLVEPGIKVEPGSNVEPGSSVDDILYGDFVAARRSHADAIATLLSEDPAYHVELGLLSDYSGGENWMILKEELEATAPGEIREGVLPGSKIFEELLYTLDPVAYADRYHLEAQSLKLMKKTQSSAARQLGGSTVQAFEELSGAEGQWRVLDLKPYAFAGGLKPKRHALIYTDDDQPDPTILGMVVID